MQVVRDDYERRSMDELEVEAIEILGKAGHTLRCGYIGERLFHDHVDFIRGSAPFARIAGKVMKRLEKKDLARYGMLNGRGEFGWHLTPKGQKARKSQ